MREARNERGEECREDDTYCESSNQRVNSVKKRARGICCRPEVRQEAAEMKLTH